MWRIGPALRNKTGRICEQLDLVCRRYPTASGWPPKASRHALACCGVAIHAHMCPMRTLWLALTVFLGALAPTGVLAHPHIFVDAGLLFERDADGRVTHVNVTWRYDELYTLILLQDYGLDPDFDLILTQAEVDATLGFDLNWGGGFEGGLHVFRGGQALELGVPEPVTLSLRPDGRLETTHRREVRGDPGAGAMLEARVYDPEFYVAFEAILPSRLVSGPADVAPCVPDLRRADLDAAYEALAQEIAAIGGSVAAEDNFPAVGALFADRLVFTCAS